MLTNFPTVDVTSDPLPSVDLHAERTTGAVAATHFPIADHVVIESAALFRMIKHAADFGNVRTATGKLTGMQFGTMIEVSAAIPEFVPPFDPNLTQEEQQQRRKDAEQQDQQHINLLSKAGFDGFCVGRYVSCSFSGLSEFNIRQLAEAMSDVPRKRGTKEQAKEARPALLLLYEPQRTSMGKLHIRAFVPTPEYAAYSRTSGGSAEFVSSNIKETGAVKQVPLVIHVSPLAELLFSQMAKQPRNVKNTIVANGDLAQFAERGMAQVAEHQRDVRQTTDAVQRRAYGSDNLRAELLFERIKGQAEYLGDLEIGNVTSVDFVRVLKDEMAPKVAK